MQAKSSSSKRNQKKTRRSNSGTGPSANAQVYTGPIRPIKNMVDNASTTLIEMSNLFPATTTSGGVLNTVIGLNMASFLDSASYIALYDEYRCISAVSEYCPNLVGTQILAPASLSYQPCVGFVDRDSAGAATSLAGSFDFESAKTFALDEHNENTKLIYRMSGSEDAQFFSTGSASVPAYFKYFSNNLSASSNYGYFFVKVTFQVRGRI